MEIDLVGIYSVANYIEHNNCSKWKIYKSNKSGTGVIPVQQSDESKTNKEAVNNFKNWANNALQNNANQNIYELKVYNKDEGENSIIKGVAQFTLLAQNLGVINGNDNNNNSEERISKAVENAIKIATLEIQLKNALDTIAEIDKDDKEFEKEFKENEEKENEEKKPNQLLDTLSQLAGLVGAVIPKKANSEIALGGVESEQTATKKLTKEQCININTAVQILFLSDSNIDKSLLKLANMSQNNKPTFNMMLGMLNKM